MAFMQDSPFPYFVGPSSQLSVEGLSPFELHITEACAQGQISVDVTEHRPLDLPPAASSHQPCHHHVDQI